MKINGQKYAENSNKKPGDVEAKSKVEILPKAKLEKEGTDQKKRVRKSLIEVQDYESNERD